VRAFVICFTIDWPYTLRDVSEVWVPELTRYQPGVPYVLVATKSDLRAEPRRESEKPLVTPAEAIQLGKQIGAYQVLECSARDFESVQRVFAAAIRAAESPPPPSPPGAERKCIIS